MIETAVSTRDLSVMLHTWTTAEIMSDHRQDRTVYAYIGYASSSRVVYQNKLFEMCIKTY